MSAGKISAAAAPHNGMRPNANRHTSYRELVRGEVERPQR